MMHQLNIDFNTKEMRFTFVTSIGSAEVAVHFNNTGEGVQPRVYVKDYIILGEKIRLTGGRTPHQLDAIAAVGMKRISGEIEDLCIANNWLLYSY